MLRRVTRHLLGTLLLLTASSIAFAQADPPGRVARISFISGSVSFRPASIDEWSPATLNYPATIGDHVWLENAARTELEWGATAVRLGPRTEISLLNLDDRSAQVRMTQGVMIVNVRALAQDETIEIDTPNGAVSLLRPGTYRIDVSENGDRSIVTVRHGEGELMAATSITRIGDGMSVVATGVDVPQTAMNAAPRIDEFEDWSLVRDRRYVTAQSSRYVPAEMIGMRISIRTATGATLPSMDRSGFRASAPSGFPIDSATGAGSNRGDGRGSTMRRGDSRRFITAAGCTCPADGDGCRDGSHARCMRRHWSHSPAGTAGAPQCRSASRSRGFPSDLAKCSSP